MKKCIKKAGELGFLGIGIPEEYGGLGLPFNTNMYCGIKLAAYSAEFSTA